MYIISIICDEAELVFIIGVITFLLMQAQN